MTQLRLDKVQFMSSVDTFINYKTLTSDIDISGTVANGATVNFSTTIPYSRTKTLANLYAKNTNTGKKMPVSGGSRINPYVPKSTETCSQISQYSGNTITVTYSIFNGTGAGITLTTQTIEITAVLFEVPFAQ